MGAKIQWSCMCSETGKYRRNVSSTSGSVKTSQWVKIAGQTLSRPEINISVFSFNLVSSSLLILKLSTIQVMGSVRYPLL